MRALAMVAFPAAVLGVALASAPVQAATRPHLGDAQVQAVVERDLKDRDIEGVTVAVTGGDVVLSGMVPSAWSRSEANTSRSRSAT